MEITREELKAKMDRGTTSSSWRRSLGGTTRRATCLPGAIDPLYEFVDDAQKLLPDKRAEIVVYCKNEECEASRQEARELEEIG